MGNRDLNAARNINTEAGETPRESGVQLIDPTVVDHEAAETSERVNEMLAPASVGKQLHNQCARIRDFAPHSQRGEAYLKARQILKSASVRELKDHILSADANKCSQNPAFYRAAVDLLEEKGVL